MNKNPNDGLRIMRDHGVYPLLDTFTNAALLPTVCGNNVIGKFVYLYVDAKGFHLVWRPVKKDKNGDPIWNGRNLLFETKSVDITAEFAKKLDYDGAAPDFGKKLDYDGEAPDFGYMTKAKDDETWFITDPEVSDGYMFTICGLRDNNGTHVTHVFATDGSHSRLLLAADSEQQTALLEHMASLEHMGIATALSHLPYDDITMIDTDADILSKAKELLK